MEYHVCREYNVEKRESGSNIIFPILLNLLGRVGSGAEEKGTKIFGKKIKILNSRDGEEYQVAGNFIHPCSSIFKLSLCSIFTYAYKRNFNSCF